MPYHLAMLPILFHILCLFYSKKVCALFSYAYAHVFSPKGTAYAHTFYTYPSPVVHQRCKQRGRKAKLRSPPKGVKYALLTPMPFLPLCTKGARACTGMRLTFGFRRRKGKQRIFERSEKIKTITSYAEIEDSRRGKQRGTYGQKE